MKQRLDSAISLLGNTGFLILDEPINGLDPKGVYEMRKMLETLNRQYGTMIMIASHILSELYKLATGYAIIDGGCLALGLVFLIASIQIWSLEAVSPTMGIGSMIGTFLGGDIVLYGFMLLTANILAEAYRSSAMKNIIGRGISKKHYYLSIYRAYHIRSICTGYAD